MPKQIVLDPSDPKTVGDWTPPGPINHDLRKFGLFPDITKWQPGDLILVSALKPDIISRGIISAQTDGGYHPDDARWHHAAVYTGGIGICEATREGVTAGLLYSYVGTNLLKIRRGPAVTRDQGWEIAVSALTRLNTRYGFEKILGLKQQSSKGFCWTQPPRAPNKEYCICSELYSDAYTCVTGKALWNMVGAEATPAFLSSTQLLQDVETNWLRIP